MMTLFCKRRIVKAGLGLGLMLVLGCNAISTFAQAENNPVQQARISAAPEPAESARVIVKFRQGSALLRLHALSATASAGESRVAVTARADLLSARLGLGLRAGRAITEQAQVVHASGISSAALAERLAGQADVEYAVIDQRRKHFALPNDPLYSAGPSIVGVSGGPAVGQWYLHAPAGEVVSSINAPNAWNMGTGSSNIVVAVLDTGVRPDHPDLAGRLLPGYDMISDAIVANDGDARDADASDPGDWVTAAEAADKASAFYQCDVEDSSWHGTMTTSLIGAASNDGIGMAGVAWGVKMLPVRVLGKCGGYDSDIIAGMQWAAGLRVPGAPANANPARVINLSLGGSGPCDQSFLDAVTAIVSKQDPVVIVAAAGNSSGHAVGVPANCPGVIGVAGLRHAGTKVGFSDLGPEISISAPAGNCVNTAAGSPCLYPILAATNSGVTTPMLSTYTDSFNASLGTSFSAPLVAGAAALMLSAQPALTPAKLRSLLQSSARAFPSRPASSASQASTIPDCHVPDANDQGECYCGTLTCGAGMLDAGAAVAAALGLQTGKSTGLGAADNVTGLWWNASEAGWGVNFNQQNAVLFATLFTYDLSGKPLWLVMSNGVRQADGSSFAGDLYQTTGPAFNANPFTPINAGNVTKVGTMSAVFSGISAATLSYSVNGTSVTKAIQPQVFGTKASVCQPTLSSRAALSDYQDLWWNPAESGWGVNVTHQDNTLFATLFSYDAAGKGMWLVMSAGSRQADGSYLGDLFQTSGPAFNAQPFTPISAGNITKVGTMQFRFSDGTHGSLVYSVNGVSVSKSIVREEFSTPLPACDFAV
jgi:serine protease